MTNTNAIKPAQNITFIFNSPILVDSKDTIISSFCSLLTFDKSISFFLFFVCGNQTHQKKLKKKKD